MKAAEGIGNRVSSSENVQNSFSGILPRQYCHNAESRYCYMACWPDGGRGKGPRRGSSDQG